MYEKIFGSGEHFPKFAVLLKKGGVGEWLKPAVC